MSYKAIYAYAWDLAETGVSEALDRFRRARPRHRHGRRQLPRRQVPAAAWQAGKVYFPEDGTVYFKADPERYGAIKPVAEFDAGRARRAARARRSGPPARPMSGWCCCTTRDSGSKHPQSAVANAFGDRYVYSLCPSAPDARAYAIGLAAT